MADQPQRCTSYAPHSLLYVVNKNETATMDNELQHCITVDGVSPYYDDQIHNGDVISFSLDVESGRYSTPDRTYAFTKVCVSVNTRPPSFHLF